MNRGVILVLLAMLSFSLVMTSVSADSYTCGTGNVITTPGSHTLASACGPIYLNQHGIIIEADNVVFDCGSTVMEGVGVIAAVDNPANNYGIWVKSADNVLIQNCYIKQFAKNIFVSDSTNVIIDGVQLEEFHIVQGSFPSQYNTYTKMSVHINNSPSTILRNSHIQPLSGLGYSGGYDNYGSSIRIEKSNNVRIENNYIESTVGNSDSAPTDYPGAAIHIVESTGTIIDSNEMIDRNSYVDDLNDPIDVTETENYGIVLTIDWSGDAHTTITNNIIKGFARGLSYEGSTVQSISDGRVEGNEFLDNIDSAVILSNQVVNHVFTKNIFNLTNDGFSEKDSEGFGGSTIITITGSDAENNVFYDNFFHNRVTNPFDIQSVPSHAAYTNNYDDTQNNFFVLDTVIPGPNILGGPNIVGNAYQADNNFGLSLRCTARSPNDGTCTEVGFIGGGYSNYNDYRPLKSDFGTFTFTPDSATCNAATGCTLRLLTNWAFGNNFQARVTQGSTVRNMPFGSGLRFAVESSPGIVSNRYDLQNAQLAGYVDIPGGVFANGNAQLRVRDTVRNVEHTVTITFDNAVASEICDNNADENSNGYFDCTDKQCYETPQICTGSTQSGLGEGSTLNYVCADTIITGGEKYCCPENHEWYGIEGCVPIPATEVGRCNDNYDNDKNDGTDCADPDCQATWTTSLDCSGNQQDSSYCTLYPSECDGHYCVDYASTYGICCPTGQVAGWNPIFNRLICLVGEDCQNEIPDADGDSFADCTDRDCNGYTLAGWPTIPKNCFNSGVTGPGQDMSSTTFHCSQGQFNQYNNVNPFASDAGGYCCPAGSEWNGAQCAPKIERCWNGVDDDDDGFIDCADVGDCFRGIGPFTINALENCSLSPQTTEYCWNNGLGWLDECKINGLPNVLGHCSNGTTNNIQTPNACCLAGQELAPASGGQWQCVNVPETNCKDNIDNDYDGYKDCLDTDCISTTNTTATDCAGSTQSGPNIFGIPYECSEVGSSGHSMCCPTGTEATHIPGPGQRWECRSISGNEICNNGIDDDGDGLIDCADEECFIDVNPADPPKCTNSLQTSAAYCIVDVNGDVDCDSAPGGHYALGSWCDLNNCSYNSLGITTYMYCGYGDDDIQQTGEEGYCCPTGKRAVFDAWIGWQCTDTEKCYDESQPLLEACHFNYEIENSNWLQSLVDFAGDSEWCVDTLNSPNRACCPVIKFGTYTYWSDENNVKIY